MLEDDKKRGFYFEVKFYYVVWVAFFLIFILFGEQLGVGLSKFFMENSCFQSTRKVASIFIVLMLMTTHFFCCLSFIIRYRSKLFDLYLRVSKIKITHRFGLLVFLIFILKMFFDVEINQLEGICYESRFGNGSLDAYTHLFSMLAYGFFGFMIVPYLVYLYFSICVLFGAKK